MLKITVATCPERISEEQMRERGEQPGGYSIGTNSLDQGGPRGGGKQRMEGRADQSWIGDVTGSGDQEALPGAGLENWMNGCAVTKVTYQNALGHEVQKNHLCCHITSSTVVEYSRFG